MRQLAEDLNLDEDELIAYAEEDTIGGWEPGGEWPIGAVFASEGRILYALIRALRPSVVVEFGVKNGCSSKHILAALVRNHKGKLVSYDPVLAVDPDSFTPAQLKHWELINDDARIAKFPSRADFVFEDNRCYGGKSAPRENGARIRVRFENGVMRNNVYFGYSYTWPDGLTDFSGIRTWMTNVQVSGNGEAGLNFRIGTTELRNVTSNNNGSDGIRSNGYSIVGDGITTCNNVKRGINAVRARLTNVTSFGNGMADIISSN